MNVTRNVWIKYHSPLDGEGNDLGGDSSTNESVSSDDSTDDDGDINWGGIADELETEDSAVEGDEVVVTEEAPAETVAPTEAPQPQKAEAPTPQVAPPAPSAPSVPTPPPAPVATNEEYSVWRNSRLSQLEQVYALDQEAADAMLTDPETVLPKLAAKVHMEVMENSMRAMQAMVPVMLQQVQYHTEREGKAKNLFTSVNPDLADPQFEPAIMELGAVYRNVNKTAPPEVAAAAIGNLVRAALGIAAPGAVAPQPQQQVQPQVAPFTPARGAGGGNAPVRSSNPFEALAQEMENEGW